MCSGAPTELAISTEIHWVNVHYFLTVLVESGLVCLVGPANRIHDPTREATVYGLPRDRLAQL